MWIFSKTDFLFTFVFLASITFFCVSAILGVSNANNVEGAGASYKIYCVLVFVAFFCKFLRLHGGSYHSQRSIFSLLVLCIYLVSGLATGFYTDKAFLCLGAFGIPSACMAVHYAHKGNIDGLVKWMELFVPLFSVSMIFIVKDLASIFDTGEAHYSQSLSYYASFCFLLNIFYLKYGNLYERFPLFEKKNYRYFYYALFPYYILVMLVGGGRGALIAALIGVVYAFLTYKKNIVKPFLFLICLGVLIYSILLSLEQYIGDELLQTFLRNFGRFSGVFSGESTLNEASTGRSSIYLHSWNLIADSPLWGYGLFGYRNALGGYPHNIFLEVLLQGGMILFLIFTWVIISYVIKLIRIIRINNKLLFFVPLTIYPFTELLFSGTYVENPIFWFCLIFVYNYKIKYIVKRI